MTTSSTRVTQAVAQSPTGAPLAGAPARYLDGGIREKTIPLSFPFELAGVEYHDVTVRKLTGAEIFKIQRATREKPEVSAEAILFSVMCKIPIAAVEALDAEDIKKLSEASADFTPQLAGMGDEPTGSDGENT